MRMRLYDKLCVCGCLQSIESALPWFRTGKHLLLHVSKIFTSLIDARMNKGLRQYPDGSHTTKPAMTTKRMYLLICLLFHGVAFHADRSRSGSHRIDKDISSVLTIGGFYPYAGILLEIDRIVGLGGKIDLLKVDIVDKDAAVLFIWRQIVIVEIKGLQLFGGPVYASGSVTPGRYCGSAAGATSA